MKNGTIMKENQDWICAKTAAELMGCKIHNVWMLIRRLSLKAKKIKGKYHTTKEWIAEYQNNKRSKDHNSIFNGRKVFNHRNGILSVSMVAKDLNVARCTVIYWIKTGKLKAYRTGHYYVIYLKDLQKAISTDKMYNIA